MSAAPFGQLASRASGDPHFLGFRLAAFAVREGLDDGALAARLGCDVSVLDNLRLCRAPRLESSIAFREDVTGIAKEFALNLATLAEAAKPLPAVPARASGASEPAGAVLAARDRSEAS